MRWSTYYDCKNQKSIVSVEPEIWFSKGYSPIRETESYVRVFITDVQGTPS